MELTDNNTFATGVKAQFLGRIERLRSYVNAGMGKATIVLGTIVVRGGRELSVFVDRRGFGHS